MKKLLILLSCLSAFFSISSCTAESVEDKEPIIMTDDTDPPPLPEHGGGDKDKDKDKG